jgi:resolvase-like protein
VLAAVAELERNIIRERVTAGLRRAKNEGKTLRRPRMIVDRERVRQMPGQANSVRIIAAQFGLSKNQLCIAALRDQLVAVIGDAESSAPRADQHAGILCDPQAWFSTGNAKPVRDLMRELERVNRGEP